MSIWFFIWLLVSLMLAGFSIWTFYIVIQQKKAWYQFARKNKLRYRKTSFMNSPHINGVYKNFTIGIFTSEHPSGDGSATRKLTAIEVEMNSRLPMAGAVGSGGMVPIVQSLEFSEEYKPDSKDWNQEYIIRCDSRRMMAEYLTPARLQALSSMMKRKNTWLIYLFKPQGTILRIDTPEPYDTLARLEKVINSLIALAETLELASGEPARLATVKAQRDAQSSIDIDDEKIAAISFELEDEEETQEPDSAPPPPETENPPG